MQNLGGVPGGDYGVVPGGRFSTDRFGGGGLGREDLGGGTGFGGMRAGGAVAGGAAYEGAAYQDATYQDQRAAAASVLKPGLEDAGGAFGRGSGMGRLEMAEALGLVMARRAADILDRHRDVLTRAPLEHDGPDARQFAMDDAVFTSVLDAANECLGRFDSRPPADRWCDALLHLLDLAHHAAESG